MMSQTSELSAAIAAFVEKELEAGPCFLVGVDTPDPDSIAVVIDSPQPVDIDYCAALSRAIRDHFGPELDDYNLEVGSAGLTAPFRVHGQYLKNVGREVEVLTAAGEKLRGTLAEAAADALTLRVPRKVRHEGAKRPVTVQEDIRIPYADVRSATLLLKF